MSNPIDPLRTLKERLTEVAATLGLELQVFATIVGAEGEPDHAQAIFTIDADLLDSEAEVKQGMKAIEAELDKLQQDQREKDLDVQEERAKESLKDLLRRNGGFLNP